MSFDQLRASTWPATVTTVSSRHSIAPKRPNWTEVGMRTWRGRSREAALRSEHVFHLDASMNGPKVAQLLQAEVWGKGEERVPRVTRIPVEDASGCI